MFKLGHLTIQENVTVYADLTSEGVALYVPKRKSKVVTWKNHILCRTHSSGEVMNVWSDNPGIMIAIELKLTNFLEDETREKMILPVNGKRLVLSKGEAACLLQDVRTISEILKKRMVKRTINNIRTFQFARDYE